MLSARVSLRCWPRKTRFRLVANLYRTGVTTPQGPNEVSVSALGYTTSSSSKLSQRNQRPSHAASGFTSA
jgi:hypothetical protein